MQERVGLDHIVHAAGRAAHRVHRARLGIRADVRLHAEVPLPALRRLMHLRIPRSGLVLGRTRGADDRSVDNGAPGDLDATAVQVAVDRCQQRLAKLVALQQMAELAHRGLVRNAFHPKVDAGEAAHRQGVVQRFLHRRVRQVEPQLQEVDPQHPLHRDRRPPAVIADLRIHRLHRSGQFRPRHDLVHVEQELCPSRGLAELLETRQRLLFHHDLPHDEAIMPQREG